MKQRDYKLDIIRVLACLMVVLMHSSSPNGGLSGVACIGIGMLTEPCIGLFFMVSGALLLPVKNSYKEFLRKRLKKIICPTLFFTIFYLVVSLCYKEITFAEFGRRILSIPFAPEGHGILWFMYTLTGLYLIAPIISPFIEKAGKREMQFILVLWLITMCWPLLEILLDVSTDNTSMLFLFSGYTGYFVLGYYLRRYPIHLKFYTIILMIAIPFGTCLMTKLLCKDVDFYKYFWYLSVLCVMLCVAWWQIIMQYIDTNKVGIKVKSLLVGFSNCSFGIYLLHIFFITRIIHPYSYLISSPIANLLMNYIIVVLVSWFICHILSQTKAGKYIIGYSHN